MLHIFYIFNFVTAKIQRIFVRPENRALENHGFLHASNTLCLTVFEGYVFDGPKIKDFGGKSMAEKILLATDNSEQAKKAGESAIAMASLGGTIIVLYVIDTDYLDALPQQDLRDRLAKNLKDEGMKAVENFREKLEEEQCAGHCKGVEFVPVIKEGKPADVILKTAEEEGVDQIVIGKSGKHGIEKFLLGSTADRVVRGAKIPVDVIS